MVTDDSRDPKYLYREADAFLFKTFVIYAIRAGRRVFIYLPQLVGQRELIPLGFFFHINRICLVLLLVLYPSTRAFGPCGRDMCRKQDHLFLIYLP